MVSMAAEPMETQMSMLHSTMLTAWLVPVLDRLPSRLLQRVFDEMVDKGWVAKSTYFLVP